jgi:hypothetical protein
MNLQLMHSLQGDTFDAMSPALAVRLTTLSRLKPATMRLSSVLQGAVLT